MNEFSNWFEDNWVSVAVLAAFIALMMFSAWWANRRKSARPGAIVIALSFYATFLSTNTFLGQAGYGYKVGIAWILGAFVFVACGFIAWFVVARRMIHDAREVLDEDTGLDQVTVPGYLALKYKSPMVGYLSASIIIAASMLYMLAVFKGVDTSSARSCTSPMKCR